MCIPGVDGYRLDDTFSMRGEEIEVGVIRESDGTSVGTVAGNRAASLIQQARLIAQVDCETSTASERAQARGVLEPPSASARAGRRRVAALERSAC